MRPQGRPVALGPCREKANHSERTSPVKAKPQASGSKPKAKARNAVVAARVKADAKREQKLMMKESLEEIAEMSTELASLENFKRELLGNEDRNETTKEEVTFDQVQVANVYSQTQSFMEHAEMIAAILIQSQWRRVLASKRAAHARHQKDTAEAAAHHLVVREIGKRVFCPLDQLSATVDSIAHIDDRIPFIHAASDKVQQDLERVLNFAPGFTLNRHVEDDMKPDRLREVLCAALKEGLTVVIDLDEHSSAKPTIAFEELCLHDICGHSFFPAEMLKRPSAILEPALYGPLCGSSGKEVEVHFSVLGLDPSASLEDIKNAHRNLIKTAHPDKGGDPDVFRKIQAAYETLTFHVTCSSQNIDFVPNPAFKLLLVSRQVDAPPGDVAQYCTPVWVTAANSVLLPGYEKPITAFKCESTSAYGIFAEIAQEDEYRFQQDFMKDRVHEDDAIEAQRRLAESIARVVSRRRLLRRRLLTQAAGQSGSTISREQKDKWRQWEKAEFHLQEVTAAVQLEEKRGQLLLMTQKEESELVKAEESTIAQLEAKIAALEKQATQGQARLQRRLIARESRLVALEAKRAQVDPNAKLEKPIAKLQQELETMEAKALEADQLDKQCEALVRQFEEEAVNLRASVENKNSASYKRMLERKNMQRQLDQDRLEACSRVWKLTHEFEEEEKRIRDQAQAIASDDEKKQSEMENVRLGSASFQELHRAVYTQNGGNSRELVDAALEGDMSMVKVLLGRGFDHESRDGCGFTALSDACCGGHYAIVELLLLLGADPNTYGTIGTPGTLECQQRTPLRRAAYNGHYKVVELLLQSGAYSLPVLREICSNSCTKEILSLMKASSSELSKERQEKRQLDLETQLTNLCQTWTTSEKRTCFLNRIRTRLISLAHKGDAYGLENLLEQFAKDEAEYNPDGPPSLNAEVRDRCGRTLLHIGAWKGHADVVEMLLTRWKIKDMSTPGLALDMMQHVFQVDVNARFGPWNGCSGWTALGVAAFMGHGRVVEILRRNGANPLLGTSFHKDTFALADALPATQKLANRNLGSSMLEYLDNRASSATKFLGDRRPGPASASKLKTDQKQLGWQLPRKRLELRDAQKLDAILSKADAEEPAPSVTLPKGAVLRCAVEDAVVFKSLSSYADIGTLYLNDVVFVEGSPEECDGYVMVPIKVPISLKREAHNLTCCYVELSLFGDHDTEGTMVKQQRRLPEESCFYRLKLEGEYSPYCLEERS